MAEVALDGQRVVLVGKAEAVLVDATAAAFTAAGARPEHVAVGDLATLDRLDVCICFARPGTGLSLLELDEDGMDAALDAALLEPQRAVLSAARRMAAHGGGAIVIVGTLDLSHAYARRSAAAVAMGGLLGLARSIAVELSTEHVRANLVLAGPLDLDDTAATDAARLERTLLRSPMHRLGSAQEAAAAIRFAAGPDSGFMTGQTLRVDGGWASLNQAPEGMRFP